ncbi:dynein heavy chain, cytoplasmic [Ceratobasidium sp. AG-Ba]|nr:dynein heavy chain, cytoplasmic [Ceratobasidium sp. AG-Ba]
MERFCGYLLRLALQNRVQPYEYLDNFIQRRAQLQIVARVNDMPSLIKPVTKLTQVLCKNSDELISTKETIYPGFEDVVFDQPVDLNPRADEDLKRQMGRYFRIPEGNHLTAAEHRAQINWDTLVHHGQVRFASMGDRVRVADRIKQDGKMRDNSFIQYKLVPDANARFVHQRDRPVRQIQYGRAIDFFYVEYVRDQD